MLMQQLLQASPAELLALALSFLTSASPVQWTIAFAALFATDICWAFYVNAAGKSPAKAANWAVALFVMGGIAVVGYTANPVLLLPSAIGAWAGTFVGVVKSLKDKTAVA